MLSQIRDVERAACGAIWCIDEQLRQPMNPKNLIIRETLRSMEYVWCLVDDQRPLLQEWIGPGSAVHYVPFGIDTDFFEYRTMPESTKPLIVSLGNDRDRDGHTLVNSLEIILQKHKSARAMVQCDARLRLPDRAQRLPRLNHIEVRKLYQQCSIVLLPTKPNTHFSGMTVALEAMATGRPVVATDTLGARDYIADKSTGCLAASAEPEQFASLVLHLLAEPDTARQLGERAATKVRENFKSSDMVNDLRALLTNSATAARRDRPRES
jgi:glycosyltransferase involved in cell wall biosynthesis